MINDITYCCYAINTQHQTISITAILANIKIRSHYNATLLSLLLFDWPVTKNVITALINYVGSSVKCKNELVIYLIIEQALQDYANVLIHKNKNKYTDNVRIIVFLESLIKAIDQHSIFKIHKSTVDEWTFGAPQNLPAWLTQHNQNNECIIVRHEQNNTELIRLMIYQAASKKPTFISTHHTSF